MLLQGISDEQGDFIKLKVDQGFHLRQSKRKRKSEKGESTNLEDLHATIGRPKGKHRRIDPPPPEVRLEKYLGRVREGREAVDGDGPSQADKLAETLRETVGRLGRARWQHERLGKGRMAAFRIQVGNKKLQRLNDSLSKTTAMHL